ncbi:Protein C10, partial [Trichinella sp. T8]
LYWIELSYRLDACSVKFPGEWWINCLECCKELLEFDFTREILVRVKKEFFCIERLSKPVEMLTKAEGRASLLHILKKLRQLQNSAAYQEAESQCGNDMLKRVQLIYPLVIRAEMNAVTDYGFAASYAGLSEYMHEIYVLSGEDKEVERLMSEVRSMIFPELPLPDATAALPL